MPKGRLETFIQTYDAGIAGSDFDSDQSADGESQRGAESAECEEDG